VVFLKRILLSFVWLLIVVSVSGVLAAFVRPTWLWPLAVLAILLPGLWILLVASLFLTAALKKWAPFGLALFIVLFMLGRHVSPARWSASIPKRGDLTLMSYNAPKNPDGEKARTEVSALIARIEPDILALQESVVWSMKRSPDILRTHRKFQYVIDSMQYVTEMPPKGGPPDVRWTHWKPPVLTRFAPDKQEQFEFRLGSADEPTFSLLRTELTWAGRKMAVYNVHLSSHGVNKPWQRPGGLVSSQAWIKYLNEIKSGFSVRVWQVARVRELLDAEKLPVVLVGDFNSTPDSWTYFQLSRGLQDAYRLSGSGWGATYHSDHPAVRIDFVLLGPEFEPVTAFVAEPYPYSSDHRPLVARFRWREETN